MYAVLDDVHFDRRGGSPVRGAGYEPDVNIRAKRLYSFTNTLIDKKNNCPVALSTSFFTNDYDFFSSLLTNTTVERRQ